LPWVESAVSTAKATLKRGGETMSASENPWPEVVNRFDMTRKVLPLRLFLVVFVISVLLIAMPIIVVIGILGVLTKTVVLIIWLIKQILWRNFR
jgi:hypothetical protein